MSLINTRRFLAAGTSLAALLIAAATRAQTKDGACAQPLSAERQRALLRYVRERYKLPDSISLELSVQGLVKDTCYRKLTFQGTSKARAWDLTLYLAPDLRFLTSALFDTSIDPAVEERAKNEALLNGSASGASPVRGPNSAPVTISIFSDFQCPFCRRLARYLDEVMADDGTGVRVVFHFVPLGGHDWALATAEAGACAQSQSNTVFWSLHDQIFRNQDAINSRNVRQKLAELAAHIKGLDAKVLRQCMAGSTSLGLVLRDMNLAKALHVEATPTLFINGERFQGIESLSQLRGLISQARSAPQQHRRSAAMP